ncbi:hypothetical protein HX052_17240 [Myroides marinus]|uniref:P-type ATPase n=1 Tax=Myroides marinus TaxID=703342 RepID=UPI0025791A0A|nr:hypothetical protein [Myroides marinus]MDM1391681.1 hypothetical protein [Myroides marinus]
MSAKKNVKQKSKDHNHSSNDGHDHNHEGNNMIKLVIFSLVMFFSGITMGNILKLEWFVNNQLLQFVWYAIAYLPVGFPVLKQAVVLLIQKREFFNEFTLMGVATLGAFFINEYAEGVAVMIFYTIGEIFQENAVNRAKSNIKALLDIRPNEATVFRNNQYIVVNPEEVVIGEIVQVKVGEKIPLDGELITNKGSFNTAALTGESKPSTYEKGETVLTGMINLQNVIEVKTTKLYQDSSLAKILEMVQPRLRIRYI